MSARVDYVNGHISLDEFERRTAEVLRAEWELDVDALSGVSIQTLDQAITEFCRLLRGGE